jgi:hypothetical protein
VIIMALHSQYLSGRGLWARFVRAVFGTDHTTCPSAKRRRRARSNKRIRPNVETLEGRLVPATVTWTGLGTTPNWSQAANWSTRKVPTSMDTVVFDGTSGARSIVDGAFAG